jgi:TolA-binding protein
MRFCPYHTLAALAACAILPCGLLRAADAPAAEPKAPAVSAAEKAKMDEEVKYINALVEANLPDFAAPVIEAAKKKWPDLGPRLEVVELQGELRLGHFDKVQAVIDKKPKGSSSYWALRLAMADAYYSRGDMPSCSKIYKEFFAAVPKPKEDIKSFYIDAAYKWAQMLVNEKNLDEAVKVYGGLLNLDMDENAWCTIATDCTELLIRLATACGDDPKKAKQKEAYLKTATGYADKLLWKDELIIVFGRAISMKAHIELLRGQLEKAQSLVESYMPQLRGIHDSLVEQDPDGSKGYVRVSPMPECRYLLAKMMWEAVQAEAKKPKADENMIKDSLFGARVNGKRNGAGAYNHAINVFVKYPESSWAAAAGELADTIAKFVKSRYKKEIKTNITADQMKKVRQMQFRHAYETYRGGDYAAAEKAYREVLAQFPEIEESVDAVATLAECYINLWQRGKTPAERLEWRLSADAVEGYMAERFSGLKRNIYRLAGDQTLRLAAKENDLGNKLGAKNLYDLYFKNFPYHYNAAQMAMSLAGQAWKNENWAEAARFYGIVAESYTNSAGYVDAVKMLSLCNGKLGNTAEEDAWLRKFASIAKKPLDRTSSTLNLALKQQKRGFELFKAAETNEAAAADLRKQGAVNVIKAIKDFNVVAKEAAEALANKAISKGDKEKFANYGEVALFLAGESYQRLQFPPDRIPTFRKAAVKQFEQYLASYPKGKFAPQALVKIGTIWTAEKNMEESQKAFARLQKDYPDSDEAKNSVPRLAKTLIEMGLQAEGVAQYRQMLSTSGKFSAGQFLAAGDALVDARGWDTAIQAYEKAAELSKGLSNGVPIAARAMIGRAKAHYGAKQWSEAHDILDKFIADEKFSKSSIVIDAYEMLVEVASEEGRVQKDDKLRVAFFNQAVEAVKKLRGFRKDQASLDELDLRSGDVMVRRMEAEEAMGLKEKALATCGLAATTFRVFLMSHAPTPEYPASKMTPAQLANLERCYTTVLPLMAKLGKSQSEAILEYGNAYLELFPDGKGKTIVINAMNQAKAE